MKPDIYQRFFEEVAEGLALVNRSGVIETVNNSFARIFGYDREELEGINVSKLLPDTVVPRHKEYMDGFYKHPVSRPMGVNRDLAGKRKDGTLVPLEISLSPVLDGEESRVAILVSDITERKLAQDEIRRLNAELKMTVDERTSDLRTSQQLYSLISQNFPNGTINVLDKDLNYVFVEGKELKKLGISSQHLFGTNYIKRLPKEVRDLIQKKLANVFQGAGERFEITLKDSTYEMTAVPLNVEGHSIDKILVVERNITEERISKEETERALKKERELNELQTRFVSMASHEFRTPLTTINSSATLISKYETEADQPKRMKHVKRIRSSVSHLTGILNDILSLSKLEEGRLEIKYSDIEIAPFMDDVLEQMELYAQGKVFIRMNITGEEYFTSDANLLRNILINLISNAVKYSFSEGEVLIEVENNGNELEITVSDQGIGIPLDDQENLFGRFFRAQNVSNIEGTGLGLNIVKRFLDLMEGNITFESEPNVLTRFRIRIPNYHG